MKCNACKAAVWAYGTFMRIPLLEKVIVEVAQLICYVGAPLVKFKSDICAGILQNQLTEALWPVLVDELLTDQTMCVFVMGWCETKTWKALDVKAVVDNIVSGKPAIAQNNDFVNNMYQKMTPRPKSELIKVAAFSDLHVDFEYAPHSNNNCGRPLCCRSKDGPGTSGKWGDF